jgi:hypothetical protein
VSAFRLISEPSYGADTKGTRSWFPDHVLLLEEMQDSENLMQIEIEPQPTATLRHAFIWVRTAVSEVSR